MLKLEKRNSALKWRKTVNKLTLDELKEYWEFHNQTEGKSVKTIKWYNDVLRLFQSVALQPRRQHALEGQPDAADQGSAWAIVPAVFSLRFDH